MTNSVIIPSNPKDLKELNRMIRELDHSMTREDGEKEYRKEVIEELSEKYGIDKKHIRRMAKEFHKNEYDKKMAETEDYGQLYESVMETNHDNNVDEEEE